MRSTLLYAAVMGVMTGHVPAQAHAPTAVQDPHPQAVSMPVVEVVGQREQRQQLPGSAVVISRETLEASRVFTTNEALRKAPGVNVRDEEGFGQRPNIGIRGLNPTRSTKVLLLEDGIPLAYAPYGDNASYFHPPVDRFDRIEVLKGAAQNAFGPQTLGAAINYITPAPPETVGGRLSLAGGSRDYFNGHLMVGGRGLLLDAIRKQGDGARDNTQMRVNDLNLKAVRALTDDQNITVRLSHFSEDSQVTYTGITELEFANFGARYNPFADDRFETRRQGASVTHEWMLSSTARLLTNAYGSRFDRDWWRQSSTTTDTQCGTAFRDARLAGDQVDPGSCNSNQGRLREYYTYGVEPRLQVDHGWLGVNNTLDVAVRLHAESQERRQVNGATPTARTGAEVENNARDTTAYAAFVQNRFEQGPWAVTPGLRIEHVRNTRTNRLGDARGRTDLTEVIPSLGVTFAVSDATTVFAGAHRGFAPPRTEDLIDNSGTEVDLDAERSTNFELGLRTQPRRGLSAEAAAFRKDFSRQIAVGAIAGGATPLAVGQTLYEGLEFTARADYGRWVDSAHNPFFEVAYTWVPTAESRTAFTQVSNGADINGSAPGNRLPYAPKHLLTTTVGYSHPLGVEARMEAVFVDEQFSDFANTVSPGANGQTGRIASHTVWNAALNYTPPGYTTTLFLAGKNLFDREYVVDRTRGLLFGMPRIVHAGVQYRF